MSLSSKIAEWLWGKVPEWDGDGDERKKLREKIHENRNEAMKSSGAARRSVKAAGEALRVAERAINLMESGTKHRDMNENKS